MAKSRKVKLMFVMGPLRCIDSPNIECSAAVCNLLEEVGMGRINKRGSFRFSVSSNETSTY